MATPFAEVIGHPIGHSKSPVIHGFWLETLGLEGSYRATSVEPDSLEGYFAERRQDPDWRGCNVTVPHKQAVLPFVDELSPLAREVGAVNLIAPGPDGLSADNSDVPGILAALPASLLPSRPLKACLIGSGGAARAALAAFRRMPLESVRVSVRNPAKGQALLDESGLPGRCGPLGDEESFAGADLIVNATTLGMGGQQPMPQLVLDRLEMLPGDAVVFDMVYSPLHTELLRNAARRGLRTVDGLAMLIGQAASAFERFFGAPAPREHDADLRRLLTS